MSENHTLTLKPGTYCLDLGDRDDVQSVSVNTIVVPKPTRICVEIVVVPKPKLRGPEQSA
jgi:hypothetical protein